MVVVTGSSGGEMTDQYLERRLETVETTLTGLREDVADMRQDMSAMRDDQVSIRQDITAVRDDQVSMRQDIAALRDDQINIRVDLSALRDDHGTLRQEVLRLRDDHGSLSQNVVAMEQRLTAAIEQTNVHMRVLHEDLVQRLADVRPSAPPRAPNPKKSAD